MKDKKKDKNKKINKMSDEQLLAKKELLEKTTEFTRQTKSKNNPQTIKWRTNHIHSSYYKELVKEVNRRKLI